MALPPGARAQWLANLPSDCADLRDALVAVADGMTSGPDDAFLQPGAAWSVEPAGTLQAGALVGPYAVVSLLGRGGMAQVWRARRADGAYEREVALKLPHAHLLAGDVRERFARERDMLAMLQHPNIASFYDAGLAADGMPFLALELVEGEPITQWAERHALGVRERLKLVCQLLGAIAHAHGKLIAHRDIKPSNVLVTKDGGVRVLDFGIAKLLASTQAQALTRHEQRVATPGYAAPEQLTGGTITVATDVYALGALLYELLTGVPPFAAAPSASEGAHAHSQPGSPWQKWARRLEREGPPRPSLEPMPPVQHMALPTVQAWRRAVEGDLDAIVAQAMQPNPADRYTSVAAMAADIQNHLCGQPIAARRLNRWQRTSKFVQRHRAGVAFAAMLSVSIVAGVAGVMWQAREASQQAARATAVKDFLLSIFAASDPRTAQDMPRGQITAKALLDASVSRIERQFGGDPALQIELLHAAADIYRELGEWATYTELHQQEMALARQHLGPAHLTVLKGLLDDATLQAELGEFASCLQRLDIFDHAFAAAGRPDPLTDARYWLQRAVCLRATPGTEAERHADVARAIALAERHGPRGRTHITALAEQSTELLYAKRPHDAVRVLRQVIALAEQAQPRNDVELVNMYGNLATLLVPLGDYEAALDALGKAARLAERTVGAHAPLALLHASQMAQIEHLLGRREQAMRRFESLVAQVPADSTQSRHMRVLEAYAGRLAAEGRASQAVPLLERVQRQVSAAPRAEHVTRRVARILGDAYARAGHPAAARRELNAALAGYETRGESGTQPAADTRERLARLMLDEGDAAAAQAQFQRVVDETQNPQWPTVALAHAGLARAALAHGNAAAAQAHIAHAQRIWATHQGYYDVRTGPYLQRVAAAVLEASGEHAQAAQLRRQALQASRHFDAPEAATATDPATLQL